MDKQKYYVSVQAHSILAEQGAAAYELEILATDADVEKLQLLFDDMLNAEESTFIRGMAPAVPYHLDDANDAYDYNLVQIYQKLYELGTNDTKSHIESMNILN